MIPLVSVYLAGLQGKSVTCVEVTSLGQRHNTYFMRMLPLDAAAFYAPRRNYLGVMTSERRRLWFYYRLFCGFIREVQIHSKSIFDPTSHTNI